ncbi:MAG: non-canonical purine NTP diphosphatase [Flavobacteriales bacterium]
MKLAFATNNPNKVKEVQSKLSNYEIVSLKELGITEDIPETGDTLDENALIKARYLYEKHNIDCFADDTGLEIEALNNEPGVYSARYAGEDKSSENNMDLVLSKLARKENRKARFRTVIALIQNGKETLMEGIVEGTIIETKTGDDGFGYDPIFMPNGFDITFAQMDIETKNRISHRGLAVDKLVGYLR